MIEFFKINKKLSFTLLLSILFFLRKGIQYASIGNYIPLLIIATLMALLVISIQKRKASFIIVKIWAIILIIWTLIRLLISMVHNIVIPFDGSFHMTQQFSGYSFIVSTLMLIIGISMFRSVNKKRIKDLP